MKIKLYWFLAFLMLLSFTACTKDEVSKITLNDSEISLKIGATDTIIAKLSYTGDISKLPVTWTSSATNIVQVNKGIITALSEGTAIVTARAGEKTATCQVTVTKGDINLVFTQAIASFWGDYFGVGTNNLSLYLLDNTLGFDTNGDLQGTGNYLYIDLNVALSDSTLKEGTYSIADKRTANTFYPGDTIHYQGNIYATGTHVMNIGATVNNAYIIKDGYYTVTRNGNGFKIEGELISSTENVIEFSYSGLIQVKNQIVSISPALTKGDLYYWGDVYNTSKSNNFSVFLGSQNINMDSLSGNGEILVLEVNTPLTVTNYIPDGTYEMMGDLKTEYLLANTLVPGYTSSTGNKWGCWYLGNTSEALQTGHAIFVKSGDKYTISYLMYNDIKTKVSGTYSGTLRYFDYSKSSTGVAAARVRKKQLLKASSSKSEDIRRVKLMPLNHY